MYPLLRMWWLTPWMQGDCRWRIPYSLTSYTGLCHFCYLRVCLATTLDFLPISWFYSCRTCSCSLAGITTLMPHMTESSSKISSVHLFQHSFNVSFTSSGQPCLVYRSTLLNIESHPVTRLSWADVMGRASICWTVKMSVSGCLLVSVLWSGRRANASAFAWTFVGRNWILY